MQKRFNIRENSLVCIAGLLSSRESVYKLQALKYATEREFDVKIAYNASIH